jgi:hypothetical protein
VGGTTLPPRSARKLACSPFLFGAPSAPRRRGTSASPQRRPAPAATPAALPHLHTDTSPGLGPSSEVTHQLDFSDASTPASRTRSVRSPPLGAPLDDAVTPTAQTRGLCLRPAPASAPSPPFPAPRAPCPASTFSRAPRAPPRAPAPPSPTPPSTRPTLQAYPCRTCRSLPSHPHPVSSPPAPASLPSCLRPRTWGTTRRDRAAGRPAARPPPLARPSVRPPPTAAARCCPGRSRWRRASCW